MKLDEILPPPAVLCHPLTGEVIDREDLDAITAALADADEYLKAWYEPRRRFYQARDELRVRRAELAPVELPRRANQTRAQERLERCPRCRTRLPRTHFEEPE